VPLLQQIVQGEVWGFLFVFLRLGAFLQLMPGIGEQAVTIRARLLLALLITLILLPLVRAKVPAVPDNPAGLMLLIGGEAIVGIAMGLAMRMIMSALNLAGSLIAIESGLAFIQTVDPTQGTQGSLVASFLSLAGLTAILASDLYILPLKALHDSYTLFPPGQWPTTSDWMHIVVDTVAGSFRLGVQMAAPFIVFGVVFNVILGVLSRLVPQMQVTFITQPAQILLSFALLSMLMGMLLTMFLTYYGQRIGTFLL
jgi:flagellar biosynthetic protein FliR